MIEHLTEAQLHNALINIACLSFLAGSVFMFGVWIVLHQIIMRYYRRNRGW